MKTNRRLYQYLQLLYQRKTHFRVRSTLGVASVALLLVANTRVARNDHVKVSANHQSSTPIQNSGVNTAIVKSALSELRLLIEESWLSLLQTIDSFWSQIKKYCRVFCRSVYLAALFSPVLLTLPLLDSPFVEARRWWWVNLKEAIIRSGPCIAKFAQWIVSRPDVIPEEGVEYLKGFMSSKRVSVTKYELEKLLDDNFGNHWHTYLTLLPNSTADIKQDIDIVGTGCVAQVVRGRWRDGSDVAIKVIHSDVHNLVLDDMSIIRYLVSELGARFKCPLGMVLEGGFDEFADMMTRQLDLTVEASNLTHFRSNFRCEEEECRRKDCTKSPPMVSFPKPMYPLVSRTVLVETFSKGKLLADLFYEGENGPDNVMDEQVRQAIAQAGFEAVLKMIFEDNFVHVDLHPGNIICDFAGPCCKPKDLNLCLTFVDAGIITELGTTDFRNFVEAMISVIFNDPDRLAKLIVERSPKGVCANPTAFKRAMKNILDVLHEENVVFDDINLRELMRKFLAACDNFGVQLEPRLIYLLLGLGMLEGIGKRLHPDINLITAAMPYIWRAGVRYVTNRERWYYSLLDLTLFELTNQR